MGDIQEEGPGAAARLITRLPDGSAIIDGTTRLDDLRRELGIVIEDSDTYTTAAGLVIATLDAIPAPGASTSGAAIGGPSWRSTARGSQS